MVGRSVLIEDAAMLLGVSRRTVYYWIKEGRLETVRTRGGSQRVLLQSIADALDQNMRDKLGLLVRSDVPAVSAAVSQPKTLAFQIETLP